MKKVIVFDLGGTLMEYKGMPLNWSEYYYKGFIKLNEVLGLRASENQLLKSVEILKSYNPRNCGRDYEIAPEIIFSKAIESWENKPSIEKVINEFFKGLDLCAITFDYSIDVLKKCKDYGCKIACLTDLPNGMPDAIIKAVITEILDMLDLYVSSQSCGMRKPNKEGLVLIAKTFNVNMSELLFIGDEEKDELTAKNAGCDFMYIDEFINYLKMKNQERLMK